MKVNKVKSIKNLDKTPNIIVCFFVKKSKHLMEELS